MLIVIYVINYSWLSFFTLRVRGHFAHVFFITLYHHHTKQTTTGLWVSWSEAGTKEVFPKVGVSANRCHVTNFIFLWKLKWFGWTRPKMLIFQHFLPFQPGGRWRCGTARQTPSWLWWACRCHCPGCRRTSASLPRFLLLGIPPALRSGCRSCTAARRCSLWWQTLCRRNCCWDPCWGTPCRTALQTRSYWARSGSQKHLEDEKWSLELGRFFLNAHSPRNEVWKCSPHGCGTSKRTIKITQPTEECCYPQLGAEVYHI